MAFDFPADPPLGQTYSGSDGVTYTWNGYAWITSGGVSGGSGYVLRTGDVMSGPLVLPDDPTQPLQAATKRYVDLATGSGSEAALPSDTNPAMDGVAAPGTENTFSRGDHVHPSDTTRASDADVVKTVPQLLVPARQVQARQNIFAAPVDALAFNGMQINGSFEVSQEYPKNSIVPADGYPADGWLLAKSGGMAANGNLVDSTVPGFANGINVTIATAQTALGGSDFLVLMQKIEGRRVARLGWGTSFGAQPVTVGFWTAHHRVGLYSVAFRNESNNRSYAASYTQNVADTPEYKTITIPGDTTGTWEKVTNVGLQVSFAIAAGAAITSPTANLWQTGNYVAAPGQVNAAAAGSDIFRIAGVVVLPGVEAPSALRSPLIMRPYDNELLLCEQQFIMYSGTGTPTEVYCSGMATSATIFYANLSHPRMRIPPVGTFSAPASFLAAVAGGAFAGTAMAQASSTRDAMQIQLTTVGGMQVGGGGALQSLSNSWIKLNSRL